LPAPCPTTVAVLAFRTDCAPESIGADRAEGAVVGLVYLKSVCAFGPGRFRRAENRYFGYARYRVVASATIGAEDGAGMTITVVIAQV